MHTRFPFGIVVDLKSPRVRKLKRDTRQEAFVPRTVPATRTYVATGERGRRWQSSWKLKKKEVAIGQVTPASPKQVYSQICSWLRCKGGKYPKCNVTTRAQQQHDGRIDDLQIDQTDDLDPNPAVLWYCAGSVPYRSTEPTCRIHGLRSCRSYGSHQPTWARSYRSGIYMLYIYLIYLPSTT